MPRCQDMGPGWRGDHPNCTYDPTYGPHGEKKIRPGTGGTEFYTVEGYSEGFKGDVKSLGFKDEFKGTTLGGSQRGGWREWEQYFDPYDPTAEGRLREGAETDIGQLRSGWDLERGHLSEDYATSTRQAGDTWAGQQEEFGRQARGYGSLWDLSQASLERQSAEAGTLWGLDKAELERQQSGFERQKGEAQTIWGLQEKSLGRQEAGLGSQERGAREAFGLQRGEMGASARSGMRRASREAGAAKRKSGLAYSGTAAGIAQETMGDISGAYERGMQGGRARLGQTVAGLGQQRAGLGEARVMGQEQLTQNLAGLSGQIEGLGSQITRGQESLAHTQADYASQIGIGQETLSQNLAGLGYARGPGGGYSLTGGGEYAEGALGYQQSMETGANDYRQALELGEYNLGQGIVDVGQKLRTNIWTERDAWLDEMEALKEDYLQDDIYKPGYSRFG